MESRQVVSEREETKMAAYTVKDFVTAIRTNDVDAMADLAKKYPVPFAKIAIAVAQAPEAMADVAELIGDATSGIKMNNAAKAVWGAEGDSKAMEAEDVDEDTTEDEQPAEKPAPKRRGRPRKAATEDAEEKPAPKRRGRPRKNPEPELVEEEVEDSEDEGENPYAGMTAPQLYKECKQRGITAKPRQKAQVYIDLLIENDNVGSDDDNDDEDDWDI